MRNIQIVNNSIDRAAFEMAKGLLTDMYGQPQVSKMQLAPSNLTSIAQLGSQNAYNFNWLLNQQANDTALTGLPLNQLKQSDIFVATGIEMSLAAGASTNATERARLHFQNNLSGIPRALRTDANFVNFETLYNSTISMVSNTVKFLDGLNTRRFKVVDFNYYQEQTVADTPDEVTIEGGYKNKLAIVELNPFILINGSQDFTFAINLPAAVPLTLSGGNVAFLRFDLYGIKAQNAANMQVLNPNRIY
jgi:hypothetical protein